MKVRFSRLAVFKLERLLEYLQVEWSEKSKLKFIEELNDTIQVLQSNPKAFPVSKVDRALRKCVVTKHTTFLYEIRNDELFILNVIDNRQDPKRIIEEIRKKF